MEKTYTLEKAAHLLNVDESRLTELVDQRLIDTVEQDGERRIPKREIARLWDWMADGDSSPVRREPAPGKKPSQRAPERVEPEDSPEDETDARDAFPVPEEGVRVEDEELLDRYREIQQYGERLHDLSARMHRLGARMNRMKTIVAGEQARFWERASSLYPELTEGRPLVVEERENDLFLHPRDETERDAFRTRLQSLLGEGVRKGYLPSGFLGIFPDRDES